SVVIAQLCLPTESSAHCVPGGTWTALGVSATSTPSPSPSCPDALSPQQYGAPPRIAHIDATPSDDPDTEVHASVPSRVGVHTGSMLPNPTPVGINPQHTSA